MIEVFIITRNIYDPRVSPYLFSVRELTLEVIIINFLIILFIMTYVNNFYCTHLIYIFDSVCLYVSNGQPQFSTDLDQMWHAASLLPPNGDVGVILQRNRTMPEHRGQFLNASRSGSSYQPRLLSVY